MVKLSIIVPVYNAEKYITKCLDSLIKQNTENIEIIIVNDGSTDESAKICDKYSKKDTRIKVIHKQNQGVSIARNEGLKIAQGEYITFVDADDWVEENTYEILLKKIEEIDTDLIIFNYNYVENKIEKNTSFPQNTYIKDNKEKIYEIQGLTLAPELGKYTDFKTTFLGLGVCWNKIYKKDIIKQNKMEFKIKEKGAINEDLLFNYEYLEYVNTVQIIDEVLYNYRQFNTSSIKRVNYKILENYKQLFSEIGKYKEKHRKDPYYQKSFYLRITISFFYEAKLYFCHRDNKKSYFKRYKEVKDCLKEEVYEKAFENIDKKYCNYKVKTVKILLNLKMYFFIFMLLEVFSKSKNSK